MSGFPPLAVKVMKMREEVSEEIYHLGYLAHRNSIVEYGLTPAALWMAGRAENHGTAVHPKKRKPDLPSKPIPGRWAYRGKRKDRDAIYVWCVARL